MEDLNSDTDTDDEDNPKKEIPKWAEGATLRTALLKQTYMGPNPDEIFFMRGENFFSNSFRVSLPLSLINGRICSELVKKP